MHAKVRGAADADADDGRRAGLAAGLQHAIDHERLDGVHAFGGDCHPEPRVVLGTRALRHHLDNQRLLVFGKIDVDDRHAAAAGGLLVHARGGMHDRRAERVFARRALAAAPDGLLQRDAVHLDPASDPHVVDRDPGVLAQEVVGVLGNSDVADHGAERAPRAGVGLAFRERVEALLDIGREQLQCPDVELLRRLLDLSQVDLHLTWMFRSLTTLAQSAVSAFIALANSSGALPTGASPCAKKRAFISVVSSALLVSRYTLSMISLGVPAGATMPNQPAFSKPGSVSAIGGTPESCGASVLLVMPRARSRPVLICPIEAARLVSAKVVSPPTSPASAGPSPL